MDNRTSAAPAVRGENIPNIVDDPVLAIMAYAFTAILSDPFMIATYGGIWLVVRMIYRGPGVPPAYNHTRRTWFFVILAVLFVVLGFPGIGHARLPWDAVFQYETQGFSISLFPGFLFLLCYLVPILIRRSADGTYALLGELGLNGRDWAVVAVACLPLFFRAFLSTGTPLSLIQGLKGYYVPGFVEELLFRGLLLSLLLRVFHACSSIAISTLLFVVAHHRLVVDVMSAPTVFDLGNIAAIAVLGLLLGWIYARTRKLGVCILIHRAVDGLVPLCHTFGIGGIDLPTLA